MATSNNLIPLDKKQPKDLFVSGGLDPLLEAVDEEARELAAAVNPDTAKGRKELASIARKVASSKTAIDAVGKEYVAEAKAKIKSVDQERKRARDFLDALRDEIRQPTTDFENAEKARVKEHEDAILELTRVGDLVIDPGYTIEMIEDLLDGIDKTLDREWEEYAEQANVAAERARTVTASQLELRKKAEAAEAAAKDAEIEAEVQRRLRKEDKIDYEAEAAAIEAQEEPKSVEEQEATLNSDAPTKANLKRHKAKVNNKALRAIAERLSPWVPPEVVDEAAKELVIQIVKGNIPGVSISYGS